MIVIFDVVLGQNLIYILGKIQEQLEDLIGAGKVQISKNENRLRQDKLFF